MVKTNVDVVSQVNPETTIITEANFRTLEAMIKSNDPADHLVAQMILVQVNVRKSIYWIWRLSKINPNRMVNLRSKAGREFRDACGLFFICTKGTIGFTSWLIQQGWLTSELQQQINYHNIHTV